MLGDNGKRSKSKYYSKSNSRNLIRNLTNCGLFVAITICSLFVCAAPIRGHIDSVLSFTGFDISSVDKMPGLTFEAYVCKLLENQGYTVDDVKGSYDFGTDIIAIYGSDKYSIQVKRSNNPINRRAISDAIGGMEYHNCNKTMVVTNSVYSKSARKFADKVGCVLVDRRILIRWIDKYQASLQ